jgi:sugar phosphate isomerase/epimerase
MKSATRKYFYIVTVLFFIAWQSTAQTIGLQLYTLRSEMAKDPKATLGKIGSWGIKYLEGGGTYGLSLEDFKAELKKNDLQVVSTGCDLYDLRDSISTVIANAKKFNAKYVVCFWIPHDGDNFTFENTAEAVKIFNEAGKVLTENGLKLCYHPHGY